jgi:hypothetical protein
MQLRNLGVRRDGHDGEAARHCLVGPAEALSQAGKRHRLPILTGNRIGLLAALDHFPVVERGRRYDAASLFAAVSERALIGRCALVGSIVQYGFQDDARFGSGFTVTNIRAMVGGRASICVRFDCRSRPPRMF